MSLKRIHLRRFLQVMDLPEKRLLSALRREVGQELRAGSSGGGDFHAPFWADVRKHVAGARDLRSETAGRISSNARRRRLYPLLRDGFLTWWDEKRRWRNEPFVPFEVNSHGELELPLFSAFIKVENAIGFKIGDQDARLVYPYFAESPPLSEGSARVGLWIMNQALSKLDSSSLRILDVLRAKSYAVSDTPFQGDEQELVNRAYARIIGAAEELRSDK